MRRSQIPSHYKLEKYDWLWYSRFDKLSNRQQFNVENIKYIFFDIGYTLVNEDNVWTERCKEQADTSQARAMGIGAHELMSEIQNASVLFKSQWKYVISKYGFAQSAKYKREFEVLYADARAVLEKLSERFRLGIIANQSGGLLQRLRDWNIDKYFTTVISSADFDFSKPDKRLFIEALEQSGCSACDAVMVGDRLDNDIMPANELGFTTVRIKQGFGKMQVAPSENYEPTYVVNNLTEILRLPFVLKKIRFGTSTL